MMWANDFKPHFFSSRECRIGRPPVKPEKKKTENTKKIELNTWRNYILDLKVLFHYDFKSRLPLEYTHFDNSGTCDEALQ